ncbi:MAG TPA: hypothetical protein VHE30_04825 [Polyangiaceae bacterium]|nr:hypothetical protein [Polyangiaceae bacterium]
MRPLVLGSCVVALGAAFLSRSARADGSPEQERARALFRAARELASAGDYETACKKFEESLALDVGVGTKFNLADCYEHSSRPLAAKSMFLDVADRSHESGQTERETVARARAAALDAKIPKLVIDVKKAPDKLVIQRDGAVVPPSAWGAPAEVEPGKHHVTAEAPGFESFGADVDVALDKSPVTLAIPELSAIEKEPAPAKTDAEPEAKAQPEDETPEPKPAPEPPPRTENDTVPILLYAGIGAGALLAGTSLVLYKASNDKAKQICPTSVSCTPDEINHHTDLVRDAQTTRNLAYVGFGIAGASAIAAGIYALTRPTGKEGRVDHARLSPDVVVSPAGFSAAVRGSF